MYFYVFTIYLDKYIFTYTIFRFVYIYNIYLYLFLYLYLYLYLYIYIYVYVYIYITFLYVYIVCSSIISRYCWLYELYFMMIVRDISLQGAAPVAVHFRVCELYQLR